MYFKMSVCWESCIFSIIILFRVTWSFRKHCNILIWCSRAFLIIINVENCGAGGNPEKKMFLIESSEKQHLFEIETFCNIINVVDNTLINLMLTS